MIDKNILGWVCIEDFEEIVDFFFSFILVFLVILV